MKKVLNKKNIIIFIITILMLLIIFSIFFNPFIYFKIKSKNIDVRVNTNFKIPKVESYFFNRNITNKVKRSGRVNINKIGTYKIRYKVKYILTTKSIILKVNVKDEEKPTIKLTGSTEVKVCPNKKYIEEGYSALDNYDKDITKKIKRKEFDNYILYSVTDSSNNTFKIKRKISYIDDERPVINVNGSNIKLLVNTKYNEKGYNATDNCDGDITNSVTVTNNLNISKVGKYNVNYIVKDSSGNETMVTRVVTVVNSSYNTNYSGIVEGPTYINGILIVNKKYSIPSSFGNGVNNEAYNAYLSLKNAASVIGYSIPFLSGYRSYYAQQSLYNNYVLRDGQNIADTYSARPGHSEHQTGLAFDVGEISNYYGDTSAGIWLKNNAHVYGFIIRYPQGKEYITGYQYEPWHIRYVGVYHATQIYNRGLTLEEYLGV